VVDSATDTDLVKAAGLFTGALHWTLSIVQSTFDEHSSLFPSSGVSGQLRPNVNFSPWASFP
jgi:hypothetical protein